MVCSFVAAVHPEFLRPYGRTDGVRSSIRPSVGFIQFAFMLNVHINALYESVHGKEEHAT